MLKINNFFFLVAATLVGVSDRASCRRMNDYVRKHGLVDPFVYRVNLSIERPSSLSDSQVNSIIDDHYDYFVQSIVRKLEPEINMVTKAIERSLHHPVLYYYASDLRDENTFTKVACLSSRSMILGKDTFQLKYGFGLATILNQCKDKGVAGLYDLTMRVRIGKDTIGVLGFDGPDRRPDMKI